MSLKLSTESNDNELKIDPDRTWQQICDAIVERWPHIHQNELRSCDYDLNSIAEMISSRSDATKDEIIGFVHKFAPQADSLLMNLKQSASDAIRHVKKQATSSVGTLYQRAEDEIVECPMRAASVALVTGVVVGTLLTTLYFKSQPKRSAWDDVRVNWLRW